jgi:hypothetical protein
MRAAFIVALKFPPEKARDVAAAEFVSAEGDEPHCTEIAPPVSDVTASTMKSPGVEEAKET